jgi:hypothetical protein
MSEYVFIIITSDACGHCHRFISNHYKDLLERLKNIEGLTLIHIKQSPTGYEHAPVGVSLNPNYVKYIGWFPEFLLVTKNSWNSSGDLEGYIFNGKINNAANTRAIPDENTQTKPITADKIMEWITSKIQQNQIAPKSVSPINNIMASRGHSYVAPKISLNFEPHKINNY